VLSFACGRPLPPADTAAGASESDAESTSGESTESTTESSAETETGDPMQACSTEWDCGVGERCLEGFCACLGCACESPNIAPATIGAPDEDDPEVPVFLDIVIPECIEDADCGVLEYCWDNECDETTACVDDLDCREDWWPEQDRFCIDDLCKRQGCNYDTQGDTSCVDGSLCAGSRCRWLAIVPSCVDTPAFHEVVAHTLNAPDNADIVILDVDLDERDDIVVLDDGFIYWLRSTGVGFDPPTPWSVEPGTQFVTIAGADVHGDGVDELLVAQADPLGVEILAVGPSWPQWIGFAETMAVPEVATMLDVDYDGLPDLVTSASVPGPMTLVEARLGDGTGTFGPWWTESLDPSVEFSQPAPAWDNATGCSRALGSIEIEDEELRAWHLEYDGAHSYNNVVNRIVAGHMFFPETPEYPPGFVATAALVDRGVLFHDGDVGFVEIEPTPESVVFMSRDPGVQHALVDHGVDMAEFVEFVGSPIEPICRGNLGFALDAAALDVGDFDGDGREDLLSRGADGLLRAWLSRD
jgi:hypothetical protein